MLIGIYQDDPMRTDKDSRLDGVEGSWEFGWRWGKLRIWMALRKVERQEWKCLSNLGMCASYNTMLPVCDDSAADDTIRGNYLCILEPHLVSAAATALFWFWLHLCFASTWPHEKIGECRLWNLIGEVSVRWPRHVTKRKMSTALLAWQAGQGKETLRFLWSQHQNRMTDNEKKDVLCVLG